MAQTIEVSPIEYAAVLHAQLRACFLHSPTHMVQDVASILNWPAERVVRNLDAEMKIVNKPHRELCRGRFQIAK